MKRTAIIILIALAVLVMTSFVLAQNNLLEINWETIVGGGGISAEPSGFSISGSMGQTAANAVSDDGIFAVRGGFWNQTTTAGDSGELYLPMVIRSG